MRGLIYISSIPWGYSWHRQQETATWLSRHGYRVLFVEPTRYAGPAVSIETRSDTLSVLSVRGFRYERCLATVNRLNARRATRAIERVAASLGMGEDTVVLFDRVHGVDVDALMRDHPCAYDLIDEITAFGRWKNERMLLGIERRVFLGAGAVFTSSHLLGERKRARYGDRAVLFVPNGVDASRFADGEDDGRRRRSGGKPIAGFIGTLSARSLDMGVVRALASCEDFETVLIGPADDPRLAEEVRGCGAMVLPAVAGAEVPAVLAGFDVGIIPYVVDSEGMDYVFPRKACEYLAAGLPVVSTPLPECAVFGDHVSIAEDPGSFVGHVRRAIELAGPETRRRQRAFVRQFDNQVLFERMNDALTGLSREGEGR